MSTITTADPALTLPPAQNGDDVLYEIVNGQYLELPPMSTYAVMIASILGEKLGAFVRSQQLGRAVVEALFALDASGKLKRRPDVAFVSYQRWAKGRPLPHTDPWPVVPDLAVEVVSPNDLAEELRIKVRDYFQAGVQQVWVIYPKLALVDVYSSVGAMHSRGRGEELEAEPVLPGLRLPVASLFEDDPAPTAP
ncbi:MAG: Uma2 family endonuclease [Gemmataceae bacterium]|nr:Uma2 family endonuclease [Gemmataceae bacterium]